MSLKEAPKPTARLGLAASRAACSDVWKSPASSALLLPLQVFIDAKYKNAYGGRHLNDEEITGMLIAGLFAGQHTSSITSAWTGLTMVANQVGYMLVTVVHSPWQESRSLSA